MINKLKKGLISLLHIEIDEILIISNIGDFIIKSSDFDYFVEDNVVTLGEEGKTLTIFLVIDSNNIKYNEENAINHFGGRK